MASRPSEQLSSRDMFAVHKLAMWPGWTIITVTMKEVFLGIIRCCHFTCTLVPEGFFFVAKPRPRSWRERERKKDNRIFHFDSQMVQKISSRVVPFENRGWPLEENISSHSEQKSEQAKANVHGNFLSICLFLCLCSSFKFFSCSFMHASKAKQWQKNSRKW